MSANILVIDPGKTNVGYAFLNKENGIIETNVISFSNQYERDGSSTQKTRSNYKSVRNQIRRKKVRRRSIHKYFKTFGCDLKNSNVKNVLGLMVKGLSQPLSMLEFAHVCLKISKRRGFVESHSDSPDKVSEYEALKESEAKLNGRYPCEFLINDDSEAKYIFSRKTHVKEFMAIARKQLEFGLTFDLDYLKKTIFFQKKPSYNKNLIQDCPYFKGKKVCCNLERDYQKYIIKNYIDNIRIVEESDSTPLPQEDKQSLLAAAMSGQKMSWSSVAKFLNKKGCTFNMQNCSTHLMYSPFDYQLRKNNDWNSLPEDLKNKVVSYLLLAQDQYETSRTKFFKLISFGLSKGLCRTLSAMVLDKKRSNMSLKAVRAALKGKKLVKYKLNISGDEYLRRYVKNKILVSQVSRIMKLVHHYCKRFPNDKLEIHIEVVEDTFINSTNEFQKQVKNKNFNDLVREVLERFNIPMTGGNFHKAKVFLNSNYASVDSEGVPQGYTFYTNRRISLLDIFNPNYNIDHILPRSKVCDNSLDNLVIELQSENLKKDNMLPIDFLGRENLNRLVAEKTRAKIKKGIIDRLKTEQLDEKKFSAVDLNLTSYSARCMIETLKHEVSFKELNAEVVPFNSQLTKAATSNLVMEDGSFYRKDREKMIHHSIDCLSVAFCANGNSRPDYNLVRENSALIFEAASKILPVSLNTKTNRGRICKDSIFSLNSGKSPETFGKMNFGLKDVSCGLRHHIVKVKNLDKPEVNSSDCKITSSYIIDRKKFKKVPNEENICTLGLRDYVKVIDSSTGDVKYYFVNYLERKTSVLLDFHKHYNLLGTVPKVRVDKKTLKEKTISKRITKGDFSLKSKNLVFLRPTNEEFRNNIKLVVIKP